MSDYLNQVYSAAKHYDLIHQDLVQDIDFFQKKCQINGGQILDLACGTGRITIPLAERGNSVTGIDLSLAMLNLAREKVYQRRSITGQPLQIDLIEGDIADFELGKKFERIIIGANSLGHLYELDSLQGFFNCVKKHLSSNGLFIIDYLNPQLEILCKNPLERRLIAKYPDPETKEMVLVYESSFYHFAKQLTRIKWHFSIGQEEIVREFYYRIFFPQELTNLLYYNGFQIKAKYGDYQENRYSDNSNLQLFICTH